MVTYPHFVAHSGAKVKDENDGEDGLDGASYEPVFGMPPEPCMDGAAPRAK